MALATLNFLLLFCIVLTRDVVSLLSGVVLGAVWVTLLELRDL